MAGSTSVGRSISTKVLEISGPPGPIGIFPTPGVSGACPCPDRWPKSLSSCACILDISSSKGVFGTSVSVGDVGVVGVGVLGVGMPGAGIVGVGIPGVGVLGVGIPGVVVGVGIPGVVVVGVGTVGVVFINTGSPFFISEVMFV